MSFDYRIGAGRRPARPAQDTASELYQDLLRKANGDRALVARWIAEISGSQRGATDDDNLHDGKDLDAAAADAGAPRTFFCPISFKLFRDPIMLPSGQSYEKRYIERWLEQGNLSCPVTGQTLSRPVALTPNVALRHSIEDWAQQHAIFLLGQDGHIRPIPDGEDFAVGAAPALAARSGGIDQEALDRALAVRLQQEDAMLLAANTRGSAPAAAPYRPPPQPVRSPPPPPLFPPPFAASSRGEPLGRSRWSGPPADIPLYLVMAANIALLVAAIGVAGWHVTPVRINPMLGPPQEYLSRLGAVDAGRVAREHQYWRLLVSPFLNAGIILEFLNASLLWTLGKHLEPHLVAPFLSVFLVYWVPGVFGSLASANLDAKYIVTGASNSVCGLLGGVLADLIFNWHRFTHHLWTAVAIIVVGAIYILLGFLPYIDNFGHLFGMATGFFLTTCLLRTFPMLDGRGRRRGQTCWHVSQLVSSAALLILLILGVVGVTRYHGSAGQNCSGCPGFACISSSHWVCTPSDTYVAPLCGFASDGNGTTAISCSTTGVVTNVTSTNSTELQSQCAAVCPADGVLPPPPSPPPGTPALPPSPPPPPGAPNADELPTTPGAAPAPGSATTTVPVESGGGPIDLG